MVSRIIDADGLILGRLASRIAKMLLLGEKVIIVNAEKAVISGKKREVFNRYKERQNIHTHTNPRRGPFWPKTPDNLVSRTIRGMLPWKKNRGRQAYKNLKVYVGIPKDIDQDEIKNKFETFSDDTFDKLKGTFISVSELAKEIGWKYKE